jgi:hypothetical protein
MYLIFNDGRKPLAGRDFFGGVAQVVCVVCVYYVRIDRSVFGFYEVPCVGERVCLYARTLSAYAYLFSVFSKKLEAKNYST